MMKKVFAALLICILPVAVLSAQDADSLHRSRYSLNVGAGWSHYFNTLELGKDNVQPEQLGFSFRFFWEPGYRLSLGLESGYYRVYRFETETPEGLVDIDTRAVPLLLVARMRIIDRFHVSAGTGLAMMYNVVKEGDQTISNQFLSLSNYEISGSYIYPLGKHFRISGEAGAYYFGETDDWMFLVQGVFGVVL